MIQKICSRLNFTNGQSDPIDTSAAEAIDLYLSLSQASPVTIPASITIQTSPDGVHWYILSTLTGPGTAGDAAIPPQAIPATTRAITVKHTPSTGGGSTLAAQLVQIILP